MARHARPLLTRGAHSRSQAANQFLVVRLEVGVPDFPLEEGLNSRLM